MTYQYQKLPILFKQYFKNFFTFFLFIIFLFINPFPVYSATYVPGESLYPNCNPPNINCDFSVTPNSTIVYIGDSWTAGNHVVLQLNNDIVSSHPFAGAGYVPVDSYPYNIALSDATKTSTGTWTDSNAARGLGPNLMHTNSSDVATPATKGVTCTGTDFTIYYLKKSGGGSFNYSIDSGSNTTISTANDANALGTIDITGQTQTQHTILMTVSAAGTTGVTLFGVDCNINNSGGIKVNKLGMSGSSGIRWAEANAGLWQSEIAELNPSLVIITLGTNDINTRSVSDFTANIETIINNIRVAKPDVPIILAPPTIGTRTGPAGDVSAYFPSLQDLARQNGYGYIEVSKFTGSYATANAAGLWIDGVHMTTAGDSLFADVLMDYLGLSASPAITSVIGNNPQNIKGGQFITINGTNFINVLAATGGITSNTVTIGDVAATNVIYVSSNKLTVTAPANVRGVADVSVANYTQNATCHNCMTYNSDFSSSTSSPNGYTKDNTKPTLIFKKTSVSEGTISSYSVSLDTEKNRNFSTSGIPANGNRTSNYVWKDDSSVKVAFVNENDSDSSNDEIQVYFKELNTTELSEGKHTWTVTKYDDLSTSNSESVDFYIDKTAPYISELSIANISAISPGGSYNLNNANRIPSFSGLANDAYKGSEITNSDNSKDTFNKVSSGPQTLTLIIKKQKSDKSYDDYLTKDFSLSDIQDSSGNNKSSRFYITTPSPLVNGYYQVNIQLKDNAGNFYYYPVFYLSTNNNLSGQSNNSLNGSSADKEKIDVETEEKKQQIQENGYTVKIKVVDKQNKPVSGAKVIIHSNVQEATTDENGIVNFSNVEPGDHRVLVSYDNYEGEQSFSLTGEMKDFNLDVTIKKKSMFTSPIFLKIVGSLSAIIIVLIFFLLKFKSKKNSN
jgi:lysophospholipase L1-like esterase